MKHLSEPFILHVGDFDLERSDGIIFSAALEQLRPGTATATVDDGLESSEVSALSCCRGIATRPRVSSAVSVVI